jgi:uncharacterized protein YhhL (DUF1145 family)
MVAPIGVQMLHSFGQIREVISKYMGLIVLHGEMGKQAHSICFDSMGIIMLGVYALRGLSKIDLTP